jgi:yeast amino acid transporter
MTFFQNYLAFPIVIIFFVGYKLFYRQWTIGVRISDIEVDEGRREVDIDEFRAEMDAERAEKATWPWWKRIWDFWM